MVQLPRTSPCWPEAEVKLETDEEDCPPLLTRKRPRPPSPTRLSRWSHGEFSDPVDGPSPLGLQLRKSPSLLDLIQMRLSQSATSAVSPCDAGRSRDAKVRDGAAGARDKIKASNFPASLLRIGTWEWFSRNEGDLVAKCYFAKQKLVWEILDGSLKNKIEIQWSDVTAVKASCTENEPGTLDLVLGRKPLFFKETNPQPKKHTLWQATSDFTDGEASIHRRHFLQCAPGLLSKHFQKLIQCDSRLNTLSRQPEFVLDTPYFEQKSTLSGDEIQEVGKCSDCYMKSEQCPNLSCSCDVSSTCSAPSTSPVCSGRDPIGRIETRSAIYGANTSTLEEVARFDQSLRENISWDDFKVPGLHPSVSMADLLNQISNCFSGKSLPEDRLLTGCSHLNPNMLEEITQFLLGDSRISPTSTEQKPMTRVDSLRCVIQNQMSSLNLPMTNNHADSQPEPPREARPLFELSTVDNNEEQKPLPGISRKESVGELLFHLPHVGSLPFILLNKADHC